MSHSRRALESPVYSSWRLVWWPAGRRCHALRTLMAIVIPFSILSPPVGCHVGLLVISFSWVPVSARVPISTGDGWPWSSLPLRSLYVPETPSCLSLRGRKDKAAELLQWLRSPQELNTIQREAAERSVFLGCVGSGPLRGQHAQDAHLAVKAPSAAVLNTCGVSHISSYRI